MSRVVPVRLYARADIDGAKRAVDGGPERNSVKGGEDCKFMICPI